MTIRIITKDDQAQNNCQIGNIGLALEVIKKWIDEKRESNIFSYR
ncbi:MAG: hypothetical protein NTV84_06660 [Methanoregula sp.]|nr:hypothetical protein [Methanoregula sp.]